MYGHAKERKKYIIVLYFFCFWNYCFMVIRNPVNQSTNFADFYVNKERGKSENESTFHTDLLILLFLAVPGHPLFENTCLAPK